MSQLERIPNTRHNRKYRCACPTSRMICAFNASGEGHRRSSRNRRKNNNRSGVSASNVIGRKSSRYDSTANESSPNVGRFPTFVTESNHSPPTRIRVT